MITSALSTDGAYQTIRLPKELAFKDVTQVELKKVGDSIVITPLRKNWQSFANVASADEDFLSEREDLMTDRIYF